MKKHLFFIPLLLFLLIPSGCQSREKVPLDLASLKAEDGTYQWPGIEYGMTMKETEQKTGYTFFDLPFSSSRGERYRKDYNPETDAFDYRNREDYEYAMFAPVKDGKTVLVTYDDAVGNLLYEFRQGKLQIVYVYFGESPSPADETIDYGGKKNDTQAVYDRLKTDLTGLYGQPTEETNRQGVTISEWKVFLNPQETEWTFISINHLSEADKEGTLVRLRVGYWKQ